MMPIFKSIRNAFEMASRKDSHLFYHATQTYQVSFSVEIKNNAADNRSFLGILPVPRSFEYQRLEGGVAFSPAGSFCAKDLVYNNEYAWWRVKIAGKSTAKVQENFSISVKPRRVPCEAISGVASDYAKLDRALVEPFLKSNRLLNGDDPRIRKIAGDVVGGETHVAEIISRLNQYVISRLSYGNPIEDLYSYTDALEKNKVDCGGFDTFLVSLLNVAGVPARIVSGFFAGYDKNSMHAWVEALLPDGTWFPLDPSMEKLAKEGKTKKSGMLGFVGSDRIALSVGCDIPLVVDGKEICVDILQNPIVMPEDSKNDFSYAVSFNTNVIG